MLGAEEQRALLEIARGSLESGVDRGRPLHPDLSRLPGPLRAPGAAFVTLEKKGALRGCIGSLEARRALALDVAENAFNAGFRDPRFPPLTAVELPDLELEISVLGPAEPLRFETEEDLVRLLEPGKDGVILECGYHRGTFLPSVWESLPDPDRFVRHLKVKAGLAPDYWSDRMRAWRYRCQRISDAS